MTRKKKKASKTSTKSRKKLSYKLSKQQKIIWGGFLFLLGIALILSFISYFFSWKADQSVIGELANREIITQNWLSKSGAWLSDLFIQRGFGVASFIFSGLIFLSGVYVLMDLGKAKLRKHWFWGILIIIWLAVLFGFFGNKNDILGGTIGYEVNTFLQDYIGKIGTSLLLLFGLITYLAARFKVTFESIAKLLQSSQEKPKCK